MSSSIFNSRIFATVFAAAVFTVAFGMYEFHVSRNYFTGGFVTVIDPKEMRRSFEHAVRQGTDTIVIGSSRAKEAIRPSVIVAAAGGMVPTAANRACHSCSAVAVARDFANSYRTTGIPPAVRMIVTVEPLAFQKIYRAKADSDDIARAAPAGTASLAGVIDTMRAINRRFLDDLNDRVSNALYAQFISMSPSQKRKFAQWMIFAARAAADPFDWSHIATTFDFVITSRMNRFFTNVVEVDAGFEGHTLKLAASDATRAEVRTNQVGLYKTYVFPNYDDSLVEELKGILKTLKAAGSKLVLVRLPIHKELYDLESEWIPQFDAQMGAVADAVGISYFPLQAAMQEFANDEMAFTDGSHFEAASTYDLTRRLWHLIESDLR